MPPLNPTHSSTFSSPVSLLHHAMQSHLPDHAFYLSEVLHQIKTCFQEKDSNLLLWIHAFGRNLQNFVYPTRPFVEAILSLPWLSLEDNLTRPLLHFLETLVSAEPQFGSCAINFLLSHFKYPDPQVLSTVSSNLYFERIHSTLKSILTTIPLGPTFAIALLERHFPHRRLPLVEQQVYLQNILKMLDYVPLLREAVFSLILEKLVLIDIDIQADLEDIDHSQRNLQFFMEINGHVNPLLSSTHGLEKTSLQAQENQSSSTLSDSAIGFMDDNDHEDVDEDDEMGMSQQSLSVEALGIKLDHALDLLFTFLSHQQTHTPSCQHETFLLCLKLFEKIMLPMYKSRYCQFLIFHLCSFDPTFTDLFLGTLTKVLLDVSQPPLLRINAVLYMASFLARANFVRFQEHVQPCFQLLLLFLHSFVTNNEVYVKHPNVEKFGVFYAATQAVLYLFCFHWKTLCRHPSPHDEEDEDEDEVGVSRGLGEKGGLEGFERILLSKFNPLLVLKPTLVDEFARITHALNILHCHAILQRNHRLYLLPSYQPTSQTLDTFFPFEPMHLPCSRKWIDPLYTEYDRPSFLDQQQQRPRPTSMSMSENEEDEAETIALPLRSAAINIEDRPSSCAVLMDYLNASSPSTGTQLQPVLLAQLGITSQ